MDKKRLTMLLDLQKKIKSSSSPPIQEDYILNRGSVCLKGVGELLGESWRILKSNFLVFIGLVVIISVIYLLIPYIFGSFWLDKTGGVIKIIIQRLLIAFVGTIGSVSLLFAIKEKEFGIYKSLKKMVYQE